MVKVFFQKKLDNPGEVLVLSQADISNPGKLVRKVYTHCQKQSLSHFADKPELQEAIDFDPIRTKRRINATLATLDVVKQRFSSLLATAPSGFCFEQDWVLSNAVAYIGFDYQEMADHALVGAAIWILDQLRESGRIQEILPMLTTDPEWLSSTGMPDMWDPCHSKELIQGVLSAIQNRNMDCRGLEELYQRNEQKHFCRCYMDLYTTEKKHKQNVPSRNRFETLMGTVSEEARKAAQDAYLEKFWEWTERYLRSRLIIAEQESKLRSDIEDYETRLQGTMEKLIGLNSALPLFPKSLPAPYAVSNPAHNGTPALGAMARYQDFAVATEKFRLEEAALNRRSELLDKRIANLRTLNYFSNVKPDAMVAEELGEDVTDIWKDFIIEDPFQLCFGFLSLLDSGSDYPWLYCPAANLHTFLCGILPWASVFSRTDIPGVWNHTNPTTGELVNGFQKAELPKRIKVPSLENWNQPTYTDNTATDPSEQRKLTLAQIVYEMTGCIMPRNLERYQPALMRLDEYGLRGKRNLLPLMYCMSLLGEASHQSRREPDQAIQETVVNEGTSSEELTSQITALQNENSQLKSRLYEAEKQFRDSKKLQNSMEQQAELDRQELADLRELVFHQQENLYLDETPSPDITFPYNTKRRIVVFGGHETWAKEMKPKLPNVRFIDREMVPNVDIIRRADTIWIQTNAIAHPFYYKITDEARKYGIPVRYFSFAGSVKCAEQIVKEDLLTA